jgi:hypothetical protein
MKGKKRKEAAAAAALLEQKTNIIKKREDMEKEKDKEDLELLKKQWKEICKNYFKLINLENNKNITTKEYNNNDS